MMGFLLLFNSIFESDIMRVSKKMVDSDLQALLCQQLLIETKETRWVHIQERNDKAITACGADWRGDTRYLVKHTNQYQAWKESECKLGNFLKVTTNRVQFFYTLWLDGIVNKKWMQNF